MLIDIHTHISTTLCPAFSARMGWKPFTADALLQHMDRDGVEQSVVQPLDSPEAHPHPIAGTLETLETCRKHAERLIPFCNVDPRMMGGHAGADLSQALAAFKDCGCVGVGELCANLPVGHPLYYNLFRHAGAMKMPVLFHLTGKTGGCYGMIDGPGLTGLEEALRAFPETVFIGHGPAFWAEIDAALDPTQRDSYPRGPIQRPGRLCDLITRHRNLYADLSGGSGHNGVSRDPAFGYAFLETHCRQVFLGTDRFAVEGASAPPILGFIQDALKSGKLSQNAFDQITHRNFLRVCGGGE